MSTERHIEPLDESEVIRRAQKDRSCFSVLYNNYFDQIFRFVYQRLGGDEALTGDITQQTFMKALMHLEKYEDRGFPFSSWLYRIAQNEVAMFFRTQKKQYTVPVDEQRIQDLAEEANLSVSYISQEDQEKLIEILNELEASHLDIIELRFFQEMSFKQISEIYSISEANAKMRTYRILERIQKRWKQKS